jgi:hypothetical protein
MINKGFLRPNAANSMQHKKKSSAKMLQIACSMEGSAPKCCK